nr:MAG: RNA-dependent RNA polymerase [Rhizoctonia solani narnavirus 11]
MREVFPRKYTVKATRPPPVSGGATMEHSRKQGGFTAFVADHICLSAQKEPYFSKVGKDLSRLRDEPTRVARREHLSWVPRPKVADGPVSRPIAIAEQGNKWRIVTKSPSDLLYTGHKARQDTFPVLGKYKPTRVPLANQDDILKFRTKSGTSRMFYSADLSNATDYLSHDAIRRVCKHLGIPDITVLSHSYLVDGEIITPKRGTFMGLPPSWVVLSVVHGSICHMVDDEDNFFIKGDDLIAWWTSSQWEEYLRLMTLAGFRINLKKSFVSKDRGWFCEKSFTATFPSDRRATLHIQKRIISLRFLTKPYDVRDPQPRWVSISRRLMTISSDCRPAFRRWVFGIVSNLLPRHMRGPTTRMRRLPIELGGVGLAFPAELNKPIDDWSMRIYSALHDGHVVPISPSSFQTVTPFTKEVSRRTPRLRSYPPNLGGLDLVDRVHFDTEMSLRTSYTATLLGFKPSFPKRLRSNYDRDRKAIFRAAKQFGHRIREPRPTVGDLMKFSSNLRYDRKEIQFSVAAGGLRFSQEFMKIMNESEKQTNISDLRLLLREILPSRHDHDEEPFLGAFDPGRIGRAARARAQAGA